MSQLNQQLRNQRILPRLQGIQDSSSQMNRAISQLNHQLDNQRIDSRLQIIEDSSSQTSQDISQLLKIAGENSGHVQNVVQKQQQQMEQLQLQYDFLLQVLCQKPSFLKETCDETKIAKSSSHIEEAESVGTGILSDNMGSPRCTCRAYTKTTQWQLLPFLQIRRIFRSSHYSFCQFYTPSKKTKELSVWLLPPKRLLAHMISVSLQTSWGAGGSSISPIMIGTKRIVDRNRSPAFQAVENIESRLWASNFRASTSCIPDLESVLTLLFSDRKASPLDEDDSGNTLLFEVLSLYTSHGRCGSDGDPGNEYFSLIQLLVEGVEDINAIASPNSNKSTPRFHNSGGTVFDLYACFVEYSSTLRLSPSRVVLDRIILNMLLSRGAELSEPINLIERIHTHYRFSYFNIETSILRKIPEQVEQCGHKYLVFTILQRSEKELLRILREVDINHKSPINGLTALHFAIEWPWALQHLLNENADINATDDFGRRLIHLAVATGHFESAIALLQADCAIMTSKTTPSLLQLALQFTNAEQRSVIIPAIVDALADRHNRLLKLGRAALPEDQLSALEILESKLERKAPDIMIALFGSGFSVPQALALDDRSVYDTGDMHGSIRLSPQYAEMLWSAGFHDIDSPNHTGLTPIMQSWYAANFEMVNWFMQKGVSGRSRHQDAPLYGLHLLAVRIAYPGAYFRHDSDLIDTDLALILNLQHDQTINHDGCVCICAPQGCTPASFLVKRVLRIYDKKLYALFPKWCEKTNPSAELLEHSAREYTRAWICRKMLLPHTCCVIGQKCEIMVQPQQPENSYEVLFIAKLFVEDYMRLYDRRRPEYGGPLENFPRLFIGEVESTSNGGFMTFPSISSMARL